MFVTETQTKEAKITDETGIDCAFCGSATVHEDDCAGQRRYLRPLPAGGRVLTRYAVFVADNQIGEVLQMRFKARRRMIGATTAWVAKAGDGKPIWAQWFNDVTEAATWLTRVVEARQRQERNEEGT